MYIAIDIDFLFLAGSKRAKDGPAKEKAEYALTSINACFESG